MDKSVSRTLFLRLWTFVPGACAAVLIPAFLTSEEQGYYYTFASIIAIQVFFELGLGQVLVYKFAGMNQGSVVEPNASTERIRLLLYASRIVYRYLAILFFVIALVIGFTFFYMKGADEVKWQGPWFFLVLSTSINLAQSVKLSYLEAIGFLHHVSIARLRGSVLATTVFVLSIILDLNLWAACALPAVNATFLTFWLYKHKNAAPYRVSRSFTDINSIDLRNIWMQDVFPMQWKISLSWISGYLIFQLYTPLVFNRLGSVQAGKLGYVISIMSSLVTVATTFTSALTPRLSHLYAAKRFDDFNSVFNKSLIQSVTALILLIFSIPIILYALGILLPGIAHKFLTPLDTLFYAVSAFLSGLCFVLSVYLRSQQDEPLLLQSTVTAMVMVPVLLFSITYSLSIMLFASSCLSFLSFLWVLAIFSSRRISLRKNMSA